MPDNDNGHDEDWEPMEIEGGSPLKVKVNADTFYVDIQAKKLVCKLRETKLDIKSMVVSSPYPNKGPKPYSRKNCVLNLENYGDVDVKVLPNKVTITTPLTGWEKADFCNVWVSTGDDGKPPDVSVKSIDVDGEADPLKEYKKVSYWYKKVKYKGA